MEKKLQIGDFVSVDNVEHYVRYPLPNDKFINESGEMVSCSEGLSLISKNTKSKNFDEFKEIEQKVLMFYDGGKHKTEINLELLDIDEIEFEFTFKKLLKEKFLMRLFPKKEKYISMIDEKEVMKLL